MGDYYNPCLRERLFGGKIMTKILYFFLICVIFFISTLTPLKEKIHNYFFPGNKFFSFFVANPIQNEKCANSFCTCVSCSYHKISTTKNCIQIHIFS